MLAVVFLALYLFTTAPLVAVLVTLHARPVEDSRLLSWGLGLQIVPVGLLFFPLGFLGLLLLAWSLIRVSRRNRRFREARFDNLAIARRWGGQYLLNLLAFGLAAEQKALSGAFAGLSAGGPWLIPGLVVASMLMWAALGLAAWLEWRRLGKLPGCEAAGGPPG